MVRSVVAAVLISSGLLACGGEAFQGGAGGAGGAGSCATPKQLTLSASCAACLQTSCCAELTACDSDSVCPSCQKDPSACATGPFASLSSCQQASCAAACEPGGEVVAACREVSGYSRLMEDGCNGCFSNTCHGDRINLTCEGDPFSECNQKCSTDDCFCKCITGHTGNCGETLRQSYVCITDKCAKLCK